jgi:hypothetical protein
MRRSWAKITFHQRQRDATSSGNRQVQLLRPRRRIRRAPNDRAARFIDDRSDSVSGRFSISTTRGQHHVPSSGLPLQPTDLPSLVTKQIAHLRPLMCQAAHPKVCHAPQRWLEPGLEWVEPMVEVVDFVCPRCTSRYKLVRVRVEPGPSVTANDSSRHLAACQRLTVRTYAHPCLRPALIELLKKTFCFHQQGEAIKVKVLRKATAKYIEPSILRHVGELLARLRTFMF